MSAPQTTSRLAQALVIEGAAQTLDEVTQGLLEAGLWDWADNNSLHKVVSFVVTGYKPAAEANERSLFLVFARQMDTLAQGIQNPVVKALALHNAATGFGRGGQLDEQKRHNEEALTTLESITMTASRDADWEVVRSKVMAGLYENGHREWNESFYLIEVLEPMMRLHFKDEAGRRHFLAQRLRNEGRLPEAREFLFPVRQDSWSAANQRDRADALLDALELELGVNSPI